MSIFVIVYNICNIYHFMQGSSVEFRFSLSELRNLNILLAIVSSLLHYYENHFFFKIHVKVNKTRINCTLNFKFCK